MAKQVYILGGGNQARETYQIYISNGLASEVAGFIVTQTRAEKQIWNKPVFDADILGHLPSGTMVVLAVGNPFDRQKWFDKIQKFNLKFDTVIDKSALLGTNVVVGEGSTVAPGSVLTCDITLGKHVIVNTNATVSHDNVLGDFVSLAPGVTLGGHTQIKAGTFVGIGSTVIQGVTIGQNCFIGAGSVVVKDIPDNTLAYGVPAKPTRNLTSKDWEEIFR